MHRARTHLHSIVGVVAAALVVAACGNGSTAETPTTDRGDGDTPAPTPQAQLDAVMDLVGPTLDALERAYPDGEESGDGEPSTDAIVDAFAAALAEIDRIEDVERHTGWSWQDPLPCGSDTEPSTGVIAIDESGGSFFIGPSSATWIAGFGEDSEGDRGIAIAPCVDGAARDWRYLEASDGSGAVRVSTISFAPDGSSERQLIDRAFEGIGSATGGQAIEVESDWTRADGLPCASSSTATRIVSEPDSPTPVDGYATDELVVAAALSEGEQDNSSPWLVGACSNGRAEELRALALPLEDLRGAAGDIAS